MKTFSFSRHFNKPLWKLTQEELKALYDEIKKVISGLLSQGQAWCKEKCASPCSRESRFLRLEVRVIPTASGEECGERFPIVIPETKSSCRVGCLTSEAAHLEIAQKIQGEINAALAAKPCPAGCAPSLDGLPNSYTILIEGGCPLFQCKLVAPALNFSVQCVKADDKGFDVFVNLVFERSCVTGTPRPPTPVPTAPDDEELLNEAAAEPTLAAEVLQP